MRNKVGWLAGWLGLRPGWLGLRPGWLGLRPGWLGLRPGWMAQRGGHTYIRTDEQTDKRMENLPILQDFVPYRGRCPKKGHLTEAISWSNLNRFKKTT